jgi:hypothetical protein
MVSIFICLLVPVGWKKRLSKEDLASVAVVRIATTPPRQLIQE